MFRQLFWKEWRENLWKLGFCCAVSAAFVVMLFRIRLFPDSANCIVISFVQMLAVPVIFALDIFSGEMSNRTIHLLFKIPVARWKIFFAKYLVCMVQMGLIFLLGGAMMEVMSQGREADVGFLLKLNASFGVTALLLFTWFCPFGAQSRSEAGSLVAMFGVLIGWGILFFWTTICGVGWAGHFVPFLCTVWVWDVRPDWFHSGQLLLSLGATVPIVIAIACWRFVKVRRWL
jgi:ABC-type transport system involved in multi-copper enzyme maturation permease subunit